MKIRILILPKFDIGPLGNGICGEGELFYKEYVEGGTEYELTGLFPGEKLYVKDGIALTLTHAGKVNTTATLMAILTDSRFDCSQMLTLSVGCAGTNYECTTMGDVVLASAYADYDLGHQVIGSDGKLTWFPDSGLCEYGCVKPDQNRINSVYEQIKDIQLDTTEKTIAFMKRNVDANHRVYPRVLKGSFITSDNYWKGEEGHNIAKKINKYYVCPDEYLVSDMEDIAVARVLERFGLLERLISIRVSVNLDCYMNRATPEKLWSSNCFEDNMLEKDNEEGADIFETAMRNLFKVGKEIVMTMDDVQKTIDDRQ